MNITVIEQSELWGEPPAYIAQTVEGCLKHLAIEEQREIAIVLSDAEQVRVLNRDYRSKDKPTNVLSFPSDAPDEWGDIILAYEVIVHEAEQQGKGFEAHLKHLLVHGTLHLLGYDHSEDGEAEEMESLEIEILRTLSVANPYETP